MVQRYNGIEPDDGGVYVLHDDYEQLRARNTELEGDLENAASRLREGRAAAIEYIAAHACMTVLLPGSEPAARYERAGKRLEVFAFGAKDNADG